MAAKSASVEIEIKLSFASPTAARRALRQAGFHIEEKRGFEVNVLYDDAQGSIRSRGIGIRHRTWHGQHIITYKGPVEPLGKSQHKKRIELETVVPDPTPLIATWEAAGLLPSFRYEKYRTVFARPRERGRAMLDETPIGTYVELEGAESWIDRTARLLGKGPADYIQASYPALQAELCRKQGVTVCNLTFTARSK